MAQPSVVLMSQGYRFSVSVERVSQPVPVFTLMPRHVRTLFLWTSL